MVERQASDESGGAREGWTALSARAVTRAADAVVVGGGPAGAMAAMALAARGVSTLLLDRKRFPRDKPCGGGIRYGVYRRFPELADYLRAAVDIHEIRKVRMEGPSGASVLTESDEPFYLTLRRTEVDAALLARARDVGARVLEAVRVTDLLRSEEHTSELQSQSNLVCRLLLEKKKIVPRSASPASL